jgi:hypothetical protein
MGTVGRFFGSFVRNVAQVGAVTAAQERDETGIVLSPLSRAYNTDGVRPDKDFELIGCIEYRKGKDATILSRILYNSFGKRFW